MHRAPVYWPAIALAFLLILLDQMSKYWIQAHVPLMSHFFQYPYGGIPVFQNLGGIDFAIVHATNKGAAWSLFSQHQFLLVAVRIVLVGALTVYLLIGKLAKWQQIPLTFIIAGAIGNIADYFLYGHVIDMLYFNFWGYDYPVFNIADSAIFIGVFWLLLDSFCKKVTKEVRS